MELADLFTPAAIAASFTQTHSNDIPYLGSSLFPARKKAGLDLSWIKGTRGLPVSLKPSAFDTKATFRDRIGVSKIATQMPFFREGYVITEKDRQEILRARDSKDPYVDAVLDHIYDDVNDLVAGAQVVPERMIMQLLAPDSGNAGIDIEANGITYKYNYDPNGTWKASNYVVVSDETAKWNVSATADPLKDIQSMLDTVEDNKGVRPNTAIMSRTTFNYLLASEKVRSAILAQNTTANVFLTDPVVKAAVAQILGVDIVVYSKKYKDESGTSHQFYPDNYVTLIARGSPLGNTFYGTTPEEADLLGSGEADVSIVNTGIAIAQIVIPHPVNIQTIVSEIVLPSYEGMDTVGVLKVA